MELGKRYLDQGVLADSQQRACWPWFHLVLICSRIVFGGFSCEDSLRTMMAGGDARFHNDGKWMRLGAESCVSMPMMLVLSALKRFKVGIP